MQVRLVVVSVHKKKSRCNRISMTYANIDTLGSADETTFAHACLQFLRADSADRRLAEYKPIVVLRVKITCFQFQGESQPSGSGIARYSTVQRVSRPLVSVSAPSDDFPLLSSS